MRRARSEPIAHCLLRNLVQQCGPRSAQMCRSVQQSRALRLSWIHQPCLGCNCPTPSCPQTPYLKWLRNQHLMSLLYMLYLIAVVVNFLGCLW